MEKDKLNVKIGKNISEKRNKLELTQKELGSIVGYSTQHIGLIEVGRDRANVHLLYELCKVFKCEVTNLLPEVRKTTVDYRNEIPSSPDKKVVLPPPNIVELVADYKKRLEDVSITYDNTGDLVEQIRLESERLVLTKVTDDLQAWIIHNY